MSELRKALMRLKARVGRERGRIRRIAKAAELGGSAASRERTHGEHSVLGMIMTFLDDELRKAATVASQPTERLEVWWCPQVPGKHFRVPVASPHEATLLLRALADYDLFQYENQIKGDYCNAGGLEVFENGEWFEWNDRDGHDIQDVMRQETERHAAG